MSVAVAFALLTSSLKSLPDSLIPHSKTEKFIQGSLDSFVFLFLPFLLSSSFIFFSSLRFDCFSHSYIVFSSSPESTKALIDTLSVVNVTLIGAVCKTVQYVFLTSSLFCVSLRIGFYFHVYFLCSLAAASGSLTVKQFLNFFGPLVIGTTATDSNSPNKAKVIFSSASYLFVSRSHCLHVLLSFPIAFSLSPQSRHISRNSDELWCDFLDDGAARIFGGELSHHLSAIQRRSLILQSSSFFRFAFIVLICLIAILPPFSCSSPSLSHIPPFFQLVGGNRDILRASPHQARAQRKVRRRRWRGKNAARM